MSEKTVSLHYESSKNISFTGTLETGIPWSEWNTMSEKEQDAVVEECLNELVDVSVIPE